MGMMISAGLEPIAGYKVIRKLGQGGFGEVWEAEAPGGVQVALKFIRLGTAQSQPELRALELIRNIRHPHLLDVQFSIRLDDLIVIAMPLCDQSLWDRLRECSEQGTPGIPRDELLRYMEELAKAVDFLNEPRHRAGDGRLIGIQHRDIKPHNIFLVGGSVRLADFGLAKFLSCTAASHTGSMSPNYVAPEALKGTVAVQSDQYALGITYYQLRTQRLPIAGQSIDQIIYNHLHGVPDVSGLPPEERPAVAKALAKEPEDRWPNCLAFVTELKRAIADGASLERTAGRASTPLANPETRPPAWATHAQTDPWPESQLGTGTLPAVGIGEVPCDVLSPPPHAPSQSFQDLGAADAPTSLHPPETRKRGRAPAIAGAVVLLGTTAAILALTRPWTSAPRGGQPSLTDEREAVGSTNQSAKSTTSLTTSTEATTHKTAPIPPMVLRFEPPTATVVIDGVPREPDEHGQITLESVGKEAVTVVARADGFQTYQKTIRVEDWKKSNDPILLEPTPLSPLELAGKAREILQAHCYRCHGIAFAVPGLDVLDRDTLLSSLTADRPPAVVSGDASQSPLVQVLERTNHAPGVPAQDRISAANRTILQRWIEAGAPAPPTEHRAPRSELEILTAIRGHLQQLPARDRRFQRYFAFTNLSNQPDVTTEQLELYRAAFAKLINSLSWRAEIIIPKTLGPDQLVCSLDLRRLGWENHELWLEILAAYPYGLKHSDDQDPRHAIEGEIKELNGEDLPYLRADWFVSNASRPPLYHRILQLPETAQALETKLGLAPGSPLRPGQAIRAGYSHSAVTNQPQIVERRAGAFGTVWTTYDFAPGSPPRDDLLHRPLGPNEPGHPFPEFAFPPTGRTIRFQLPNGLLASLIVDPSGRRIDAAPGAAAADPLHSAGASALVNGISCLACHRNGPFPVQDEVRQGHAVSGVANTRVLELYGPSSTWDSFRQDDQRKYQDALDSATREFLKHPRDARRRTENFPEPIQILVRRFGKSLDAKAVAIELGLSNADAVAETIERTPRLLKLGLQPLVHGQSIPRDTWTNAFPQAALELNAGTPHHSF